MSATAPGFARRSISPSSGSKSSFPKRRFRELKPEFAELKEDVIHLGGTKKIRELLAAEEHTNRQAFVQNRRVIVTTAARVAADPLFRKVRFDVLIAEEAPRIPSPFLLAAAGWCANALCSPAICGK